MALAMEPTTPRQLITVAEAERILGGVRPTTVYSLIARGRLSRVMRGGEVLLDAAEVRSFATTYTPPSMVARAALRAIAMLEPEEAVAAASLRDGSRK